VDRALRPHRIREGGEPFVGATVRGHDDRSGAVALGEDLVSVAALLRVHCVEAEIVDDEQVHREELAQLCSYELSSRECLRILSIWSARIASTLRPRRQAA